MVRREKDFSSERRGEATKKGESSGFELVETGNEAPGAAEIGFVFGAEVFAEQAFFRVDACDKRYEQEKCDGDAGPRAEGEAPADHVDDHAEIAGITDDAVDAARFEFVIGLDCDESAEAPAEDEYWVQAKYAATCVNAETDPARRFAVDRPGANAVGVRRDDGAGERDDAEGDEDPAIGAILLFARAEIDVAEGRDDQHRQRYGDKCD